MRLNGKLQCDMDRDCKRPVTHIGHKGYVYCTEHALDRRAAGFERTRKMLVKEKQKLEGGGQIKYLRPIKGDDSDARQRHDERTEDLKR